MAQIVRKITPEILKKIIVQEARKLQMEAAQEDAEHPSEVDAPETDASEYAGSVEHKIDYMKALDIHESRLRAKLAKVQEAKRKIAKSAAH